MTKKEKNLTPEQQAVTDALKLIWDRKRAELKLTQESVAAEFGITQGGVGGFLNGWTPLNTDNIIKFSKALKVHPSEINPRLGSDLGITEIPTESGKDLFEQMKKRIDKLSDKEFAKFLAHGEARLDSRDPDN